jgi:radical SAM protein with 4Fe4S-binding SPASM domain
MIDWNGDIYLCTQDWNRKVKSGNIKNENFFDIWNSNILKEYRKNLSKGLRVKEPCINCNANGVLHGQNHALAWEFVTFFSAKRVARVCLNKCG